MTEPAEGAISPDVVGSRQLLAFNYAFHFNEFQKINNLFGTCVPCTATGRVIKYVCMSKICL